MASKEQKYVNLAVIIYHQQTSPAYLHALYTNQATGTE